jgi:hypothetical protein
MSRLTIDFVMDVATWHISVPHVSETRGVLMNETVMLLRLSWSSLDDLSKLHCCFQLGRSKYNISDMVSGLNPYLRLCLLRKTTVIPTVKPSGTFLPNIRKELLRNQSRPFGRKGTAATPGLDHAMKLNRQFSHVSLRSIFDGCFNW